MIFYLIFIYLFESNNVRFLQFKKLFLGKPVVKNIEKLINHTVKLVHKPVKENAIVEFTDKSIVTSK